MGFYSLLLHDLGQKMPKRIAGSEEKSHLGGFFFRRNKKKKRENGEGIWYGRKETMYFTD